MIVDPTRVCEVLVGLGDVRVLGADDVGEFQRSVHGPGMIAGAVDHHRPLENPGCQARRCRCPNAKRSLTR